MRIAAFLSLVCPAFGFAASTSGSEGAPKPELYESRPVKAVTFIVNSKGNPSLKSISLSTIRKIYNCTLRNWKDAPGSSRTDDILPIAIWEKDEVTQVLQKRIPKFELGPCVTSISGPDPSRGVFYAIGVTLPNNIGVKGEAYNAIGFMNYGPLRTGQTALAISDDLHKKKPVAPVAPSEASVKNRAYPLVR